MQGELGLVSFKQMFTKPLETSQNLLHLPQRDKIKPLIKINVQNKAILKLVQVIVVDPN